MAFRWEHFVNTFESRSVGGGLDSHGSKHTHYVREFASIVSEFQDRTDSLVDLYADLSRTIDELKTCAYTSEAFSTHLATIQKTIDNLNLEGYANLETWVRQLDDKVETVLSARLRTTIDRWCTEFSKEAENGESSLSSRKKAQAAKLVSFFPTWSRGGAPRSF
jgi:dynein heavy chain 1